MNNKPPNKLAPPNPGFFQDILLQIKLIYRLMGDRRVNPFLKLLPIGGLIYFIVPDLAVGPLDDAVVIGLASYLFIELCPDNVVQEHRQKLRSNSQPQPVDIKEDDQVIDAEFKEKDKEE